MTYWASLLPLRGIVVTLELLEPARFRIYHHAALTAFLRHLLGSPKGYENHLVVDAPESGRTHYRAGDHYTFTLLALRGGEPLLQQALDSLRRLPFSAVRGEPWIPLRDNLRFVRVQDLLTGERVARIADCMPYSQDSLAIEARLWQEEAAPVVWRWISPARISRPPVPEEQRQRGRLPFCRNEEDLSGELLLRRCHDAAIGLVHRRTGERPRRPPIPAIPEGEIIAFWLDNHYQQPSGKRRRMGGLCGSVVLHPPADLAPLHWQTLVLGQYLGIGENRAFGLGRYRLCTPAGAVTMHRARAAHHLVRRVAEWDNLVEAFRLVRQRAGDRDTIPRLGERRTTRFLQQLQRELREHSYRPATLQIVLDRKKDGGARVLAIPPWQDRVAQRAVSQVLAAGLENAFHPDSHGYREGRGRHSARDAILQAWKEGYRWVFESDIEDFFPSVRWDHLHARLQALYGDDPLVELMMEWVRAPMEYEGRPLRRDRGLPQGSSLSPLFANLLLDDFDRDMEAAGFRMIRFADDFVILCKHPDRARAAQEAVEQSLQDLELELKERKTAVRHFRDGFRYLGFLFLNDLVLDAPAAPAGRATGPLELPPEWLVMLADRPSQPLTSEQAESGRLPEREDEPPAGALPGEEPAERPEAAPDGVGGALVMVTGEPSLLVTRNQRLQVQRDDRILLDHPWSAVHTVILFGPQHITTPALRAALRRGIAVHFCSGGGRYQGTAANPRAAGQGVALWLEQQRRCREPGWAMAAARAVVEARIRHMRELLRQAEGDDTESRHSMKRLLQQLEEAPDPATLNGLEGQATRIFFTALQRLLPAEWEFPGRRRRPAPDPFNALLSLGYTVLYNHADSLLRADGLLPEVGFYHQGGGTHAALASDLMEPFRHFVERTALDALLRRRLTPDDFERRDVGGCRLSRDALRRYLAMIGKRLDRPVRALGEERPLELRRQLHNQNLSLIRAIRGEGPFRPFLQR